MKLLHSPMNSPLSSMGRKKIDDEFLHLAGVKDMTKVVIVEDSASNKKKPKDMKSYQVTEKAKACHAVAQVRAQVDELGRQAFPPESYHHIQALCLRGELEKALSCLFQLEMAPSHSVYILLLKLCQREKSLVHVHYVLAHLVSHQWDLVHLFGDFLVFVLAKCGGVEDALHVLINLPHPTVFAWTSIIARYAECGRGLEALRMHSCMLDDGVKPDRYTFVSLFKACGSILDIQVGRKLHVDAEEKGLTSDLYVGSTLVSMYGKCGNTEDAEWVFCGLSQRSVVTWNAMLSAY
eukprot:c11690_g2_i1 orf=1-876(-)